MSLSTALTSVKSNFTKYLAKGAGAAALGVVAYDSHIIGKIQSDVYAKAEMQMLVLTDLAIRNTFQARATQLQN